MSNLPVILEVHPYPEEALCDEGQGPTQADRIQAEVVQIINGLGPNLELRGRYL